MLYKLIVPLLNSPIKLLFISWLLVSLIYFASPIQFNQEWTTHTTVFVIGFFTIFTIGYLSGKEFVIIISDTFRINLFRQSRRKNSAIKNTATGKIDVNYRLDKFTNLIAVIGLIGSLMLAMDLLFARGIDFRQGISLARDLMNQQVIEQGGIPSGRIWSISARVLTGFLPIAALIALLRIEQFRASTLRMVFLSLIVQFACDTLSGGRNNIFMTLVILSMAILLRLIQGRKHILSHFIILRFFRKWGLPLVLIFLGYILFIFIDRESIRGRDLFQAYENIENSWLITLSFDITHLTINEGFIANITLACVYLLLYFVHGLNELNLLCSQIPEPGPFYGVHALFLPALFANKLGLISSDNILGVSESLERSGIYFTALGSLYLDFGYTFSFVVFLLLGLCTGFLWKLFKLGYGLCVEMLCAYLLLSVTISPFFLSLNTGNGFQILLALVVSGTIISLRKLD